MGTTPAGQLPGLQSTRPGSLAYEVEAISLHAPEYGKVPYRAGMGNAPCRSLIRQLASPRIRKCYYLPRCWWGNHSAPLVKRGETRLKRRVG